ncbi:MAG TPA: bifunctional 2-polyprenyl-6-hydroxyphenol methylase/3-demethylubiquinol 3-O-methyltransferase UbiG [Pelagibacterium sp.]|uniref:bifunctional 2-polyprenyl-6-hydroxyphenol methylase/3-demethylubiquinol 3-O-methyltransferase UbiG n=1 Tax=Pelagibacterium sp. TaxID=1967288 RepID=UPI002CFADC8A|nr:bifunctional 2-polyprenyl-6-hydroxyphenol methylase/3-demethylubiquinol 3-O-methyltransferase UbiG [Pelagibacterium sp.]HWJ87480.1 bifunctional 2-polyprenyl-6-hydroxyphenol methylase/3-demethylubiquinol 3-O-methyltransferase UbiG [Pelagibacterium sp.]
MSTISPEEIGKFHAMAAEWWDPNGKFRPLHKFNPVRLGYIREQVLSHFGRDGSAMRPFEGLRILDIGCGGGLLCEPIARLGADVVGADAGEQNVRVAALHAEQSGLAIDYRATTAEALAASGEQFDVVLNMEVVEHVADVPLYLESCATLVKPGGLMFVASINRTARAYALAIVAAERILRWLPRGTHDYEKLVTPEEITSITSRHGLLTIDRTGVSFNPLKNQWDRSRDMAVNYMLLLEKPNR